MSPSALRTQNRDKRMQMHAELGNHQNKVVCAGIPRSGTTMVYRALVGLPAGDTTPKPQIGPVVKTHSFDPSDFKGAAAAIFLFSDPIDSVLSTRASRWDVGHFANCGAVETDLEVADIFGRDFLNYERMFDAWMRRQLFTTICVRYECLHKYSVVISDVLKMPLNLPEYRPRRNYSDIFDAKDVKRAQETYSSLSRKIRRAPDISIWTAS